MLLTFPEFISSNTDNFRELLPNYTIKNLFQSSYHTNNLSHKKFSNRKFSSKSETSLHKHMKQIILSSTILEFTWLVIDGFIEETGLASPLPKGIRSTQYRRPPRNLKFCQLLTTRHKKILAPTKRYLWVEGEVYTMQNMDTNTDYKKVITVGDWAWEIAENTIRIIFFVWDLYSLFFKQGAFKSHLKKNKSHLKCQFPPKIPIWPMSLLYKLHEKWLTPISPWVGVSGSVQTMNVFAT